MRPLVLTLSMLLSSMACAKKKDAESWDIEESYKYSQSWKATLSTGTWLNVDVHPDGAQIAFDLLGDLYLLPLEGGEARVLSRGPAWDQDPRFSPDGERLLYVSDRGGNQDLWVMDLASGETSRLTEGAPERFAEGTWSPDGRYVVARKRVIDTRSIGMSELWLFDTRGGDGVQLTETKAHPFPTEATFSKDGKHLYFSSTPWRFDYGRDPNQGVFDLHRMDLETGEVVRLTAEAGSAFRPTVNPVSGEVALMQRKAGATVLTLFDPETGARRPLGDRVFEHDNQEGFVLNGLYPHAAWTPDGKTLVIWDDGTLVRVDGATGQATPISWTADVALDLAEHVRFEVPVAREDTVQARAIRWPTVSPQGDRVVFEAFGRLWLQALGGGPASPITPPDRRAVAPSWSPDGARLVYATWTDADAGAVVVRDMASGSERTLTAVPAQYLAPAFSPDGQRVAWLRGSGATLRGLDTSQELWFRLEIWDDGAVSDGGEYGGSYGGNRAHRLAWSADGARLLLVDDEPQDKPHTHDKTVLVSVDPDGRDRRVVARWDRATEVAVSPDGRRVAYVENFHVYAADLPLVGDQTLELGPKDGALPVTSLSEGSGGWLSWAGDQVTWSLGRELHVGDATHTLDASLPRAAREGRYAYVNARVLTMGEAGVIDGATVLIDGERVVSVGAEPPPQGVPVVDLGGKTLLPGFIDVHAHLHYGASDVQPQASWRHRVNLAYGVTSAHDPSAHNDTVFATSERIEAGLELGPRTWSTGWILYGAKAKGRSWIASYEDALAHVRRQKAWGAVSVKSYQQPAREQRQWVLNAARAEGINVYPEGGGDLFNNMNMLVDGHTGIEHALPVAPLYDDVIGLYAASGAGYTPTLLVAYGGLSGENWFYQTESLLEDEKFLTFTPAWWVDRSVRRRGVLVNDDDWYFKEVARSAAALSEAGVPVNLGAHGQIQGVGVHWELWALGEAMGPEAALRAATINGAWYIGVDKDLGSVEPGKLADLIVLDGDPLADLRVTMNLVEVVKGGVRYDPDTLEVIE
ncbi:MAG: PD40 domain-containing protein [Alphaproteobacteria bacterium]|nr:PD40 domain-containing protein [Alphaproteobacteria bacterium]